MKFDFHISVGIFLAAVCVGTTEIGEVLNIFYETVQNKSPEYFARIDVQ